MSVIEIKDHSESAALWDPESVLLRFAKEIKEGRVNPKRMLLIIDDGDSVMTVNSRCDTAQAYLMLALAQATLLEERSAD